MHSAVTFSVTSAVTTARKVLLLLLRLLLNKLTGITPSLPQERVTLWLV